MVVLLYGSIHNAEKMPSAQKGSQTLDAVNAGITESACVKSQTLNKLCVLSWPQFLF